MRRAAKHLSYANVAATRGARAVDERRRVGRKHYLINSASQINPKVLKTLRGRTGARGPQGATGAAGPRGPDGQQGRQGPEGREGKAATISPVVWTPLTLENKWELFDPADGGARVHQGRPGLRAPERRDQRRIEHLDAVRGAAAGFRPTTEGLLVHAAGTNAVSAEALVDVFIEEDGAMFAEPADRATTAGS